MTEFRPEEGAKRETSTTSLRARGEKLNIESGARDRHLLTLPRSAEVHFKFPPPDRNTPKMSSEKKKFVTVLPAPGREPPPEGGSGSHSRLSGLPPKRQKRAGTGRFACDACRSRKSAVRSRSFSFSSRTCVESRCVALHFRGGGN